MVSRHQLRKAIEIIESASSEGFKEITEELNSTIQRLKVELEKTDQHWQLLNNDIGKTQVLYGFDESFFKKLQITHSYTVTNFIKDWLEKQSDWRYPLCLIAPTNTLYTEQFLKSNLVYVCSNNIDELQIISHVKSILDKKITSDPRMFRLKPLDHTGKIENENVPYNQIGTCLSVDYFPYLSIEQIKNFFISFEKILRPGGQCMIHITDADCESEWQSVLGKKITYCTTKIVKDLCDLTNLELVKYYHVDSMYTFFNIKKPGDLTTQKYMPTKIQKILR